tara:strand:+ start:393 stop:635 length:243 start_codon:yes stop_codon:yes gene_type:complete
MADQFFKYVDGVLKSYTSASYLSAFGHLPTQPRDGERLFGGRYENRTFYTASSDYPHGEEGLGASLRNTGNDSGSYNIDF